ncbi:SDR family oxidoreductase [Teredinibacter sp. KSP-S5-2]|uniref:SDR family oxidoreductase n=1 Tax=Teredinibacter sp. KSP-S5-2 TaxID=3034506 RepID=UPI0029346069|nr:SDR family NAD(P)-dependent oxidoreductase [Teredinibacter sp. KSP-S5-2]WNO08026.1 SDR family NAD(P)-dependent oxidoreductase [Teredinibacter sp. KSP-S5-2]
MKLSGNTILITGGSEGIGLELAKQLHPNNQIIICGRTEEKLNQAKSHTPSLHTIQCDITDKNQVKSMLEQIQKEHKKIDVLINNAGSKTETNLRTDNEDTTLKKLEQDFAINYYAPINLIHQYLPLLKRTEQAAIINITTGLIYLPKAQQAFYCAAKSALHSYTQSLRWSLQDTGIQIIEVIMPLVNTNFHKGTLPSSIEAMPANIAAQKTIRAIRQDKHEIRLGKSNLARYLAYFLKKTGMRLINQN